MNIFYYSKFSNETEWLIILKKKFKGHKIITIKDNFDYQKIDIAIIWNLPNSIFKKLSNIKVIFSLGAGVDHILKLPSYNKTPIFRIKDPNMRERMFNHALSQILNYQLKLNFYQNSQQKKLWLDERKTMLNKELTVGILGLGYIGEYVAKKLQNLNYNVIGYKNSPTLKKNNFKIFTKKKITHFIFSSDIIVSILPSTKETKDLINKKFLTKMKKNSLLINIGRGSSLNEKDLINHLKINCNFFVSLDVFKKEPLAKNHKFWRHPNITITPHIAAITDIDSSIEYMYKRFLTIINNKKIKSDVNLKKGY
tara:strand:- start:1657 stop:2586 length:930 start_codon:yes stop_codon:yes gene_type:complete